MEAQTFDDLEDGNDSSDHKSAFFEVIKRSDDEILKWLNADRENIEKENEPRLRTIKKNLARYRGMQYQSQETRGSNRDRDGRRSKMSPKMVVNVLKDITEQRVARLVEYKPGVAVIPTNDEFSDKVASITAKRYWSHIKYVQKFDDKAHKNVRISDICSESYLAVFWNSDLGPIHPDYDPKKKEEYLDENGEAVRGSDGKKKTIDKPVRVGDVHLRRYLPTDVFLDIQEDWDDVRHCHLRERRSVDELKEDHPSKAKHISGDSGETYYDFSKMQEKPLEGRIFVYRFYHKRTKYVPEGAEIWYTKKAILKKGPLGEEYPDDKWPLTRLVDEDVPGECHGESHYSDLKSMSTQYNNLTNMIVRNQMLVAHPKWFVESGSVNKEDLNNDISIVKIKRGAKSPVLGQANPTPSEVFNFRKDLKDEIYQHGLVSSFQRGEPPPGIKAFVAMQYFTEQENRRQNPRVARYNSWVVEVADLTICVASKKYAPSDKRTMMVLGRSSSWFTKELDPSKLARPFDIRIQNTSSLPDSKAARFQFILDMAERFPEFFPREQVVEMLELGQADKFMDEASSSSRSAEYENELILEGEELPDPEIYENLLIHWKVHVKAIQDLSFKRKTPDEIKNKMKEHIMATEMLMGQMAERNPEFGKVLLTLSQFPLFFYPETKPQIPMAGQDATLLPVEPPAPAVLPADVLPPEQMPPLPENQAPSAIQPAGEPMVGPPGVAISPSIEQ